MQFDSFYFLNPHKTAGRYIYRNIVFQIKETLEKHNIKIINKEIDYSIPHLGWHPEITDNTFILSSFREPIYQVVSLYASNGNTTKDHLIEHLYDKQSIFFNNQSKSLCFHTNLEDFAQNCDQPDLDLSIFRAKRINKVINPGRSINNVDICNDILMKLGINDNINIHLQEDYFNQNEYSKQIYESLSDSEKNEIINQSEIDYQVYSMLNNS